MAALCPSPLDSFLSANIHVDSCVKVEVGFAVNGKLLLYFLSVEERLFSGWPDSSSELPAINCVAHATSFLWHWARFQRPPPFQGVKISWAADTPVQSVSPWLTNPFSCLPYKKWDSWQALSPGAQTVVDAAVQVQDASAWDDRDPHQVRQALPSYRAFCSWVLPSMVCCWHWAWTFWLFTFLADLCPSTVEALVQTNLQKITSNKIFTKWDSMCGYTQTPLQW